ncbi:hypothetical protein UCRPA7_5509 [Phaeoacremonium minimum UCRPA7]|uniref:Uncharacterized protein n=1 Tax=Phaeoacremonium minimum (strain UCR-PA7) TaxID=1286976 RepID=R8BI56_PHAM7|nr:hypothetical protein UCRPA7_5509 [Phaeoacremonium minimum UCRPA7]EON99008.1 hypothetical protein UCRPA7_5509 [Phaeoacremonium minimum UCRPA7]
MLPGIAAEMANSHDQPKYGTNIQSLEADTEYILPIATENDPDSDYFPDDVNMVESAPRDSEGHGECSVTQATRSLLSATRQAPSPPHSEEDSQEESDHEYVSRNKIVDGVIRHIVSEPGDFQNMLPPYMIFEIEFANPTKAEDIEFCLTVSNRDRQRRLENPDLPFGVKINAWRCAKDERDAEQRCAVSHIITNLVLRPDPLRPSEVSALANTHASDEAVDLRLSDFHPGLPSDVPVRITKQAILELVDRAAVAQCKEDAQVAAMRNSQKQICGRRIDRQRPAH